MERGNEEISDKQVTIFLIAAIVISLVSTLTVLVTLDEVKEESKDNQEKSKGPANLGSGLISLSITEREEAPNATKQ